MTFNGCVIHATNDTSGNKLSLREAFHIGEYKDVLRAKLAVINLDSEGYNYKKYNSLCGIKSPVIPQKINGSYSGKIEYIP